MVGFCRVRKHHRHSGCFSGNDKRAEVLPKALDFGFGAFLLDRLFCYFRHATGRSICFTGMRSAEVSVARTSSRIKAVVALITMPRRLFVCGKSRPGSTGSAGLSDDLTAEAEVDAGE